MYAIVKTGGKQYRVESGQQLLIERVAAEEGADVALEPVFYRSEQAIFEPEALKGVQVTARVLGHVRGPKLRVFKFKPKRGYKRRTGHPQELTRIEVTQIAHSGATRRGGQPAAKAGRAPAKAGQAQAKAGQAPAKAGQAQAKAGRSPVKEGQAAKEGQPATKAGRAPRKEGPAADKAKAQAEAPESAAGAKAKPGAGKTDTGKTGAGKTGAGKTGADKTGAGKTDAGKAASKRSTQRKDKDDGA
jgi:large subunit ribosomal protein L21